MCERLEKWIPTLVGVGKKNKWLRYPIVLLLVVMTGLYAVCDWIWTTVMPRAKGVATMIQTTGGRTKALLVDKVHDIKERKNKISMEDKVKAFTHPRMRRRVLTVALSFCVVLTTMPVAAFGTETPENAGGGGYCTCTTPAINEAFSDKTVEAEAFPYALDFDAAGGKVGGECTVEGHQNTDVTYTYSFVSATGENTATVAPKENDGAKTTLTFPVADAYTMKCVAEANGMTTEKEAVFDLVEKAPIVNKLPAAKTATTVTTWAELTAAIGSALTDGTETVINIEGTIDATSITSPIAISQDEKIVINGGTIETTKKLFSIISGGTLTLNGLRLAGKNVAPETRNIVGNDGTLIINDGCVFENFAFTGSTPYQGIIENYSRKDNPPILHINGGVFRNNTSSNTQSFSGVAIYNSSKVCIAGGTFSNNTHTGAGYGAAVYNSSQAKCYISGGTFESNNIADSNKAGIFHSSQDQEAPSEMHLSGNPAINCPLFLDAGISSKYIYLDGGLKGNVTLKPAKHDEGYVLVKANEGYTLTNEDYLRINLLQPGGGTQWYTKLSEDKTSIVATKNQGSRLTTVYLSLGGGNDEADGSTKDTAVKTFDRAKQILAQGGKIVLIPPATISGNQLWELPENVFGSAAAVTDEAGNTTITVTGTLDLGDIKIEGIDQIIVEAGGNVSIGNNTTVTGGTGGSTTDVVVKPGGTLDVGGTTNLDGIGTIYVPEGATVNDNGNASVAGNTNNSLPPPTDDEQVAIAKTLAEEALNNLVVANGTTADEILTAVNDAITTTGVTAAWKSPSDFVKTDATVTAQGSIAGTIVLTLKTASDNLTVNLIITKIPSYTIKGTITGSDTNSGIPATLQLKDGNGNVGNSITASADGTYTISNVPVGMYTIEVSCAGYDTGTISAVSITNADVTGKNITLTKTPTPPVGDHAHPVCGGSTCAGDHESHKSDVTYVALDDGKGNIKSDNLVDNSVGQLKAGHYYLTSEVTYDESSLRILSGINADICLNGYKLILSQTYGNLYMDGTTVNIGDCKSKGEIVSENSSAMFLSSNSTANLYNIIANGNQAEGSVKNQEGTLNIFGGTITNSNADANAYDVYNRNTLKMEGNVNLSKGIRLSESKTITLSGKMTNKKAIPINLEKVIDGGTVIKSDGKYTITEEDMGKFTLKNSGYSLQLQGTGKDAKVVVGKGTPTPPVEEPHKHPVCGGSTCADVHGSHDANVDYVALDDGNGNIKAEYLEKKSSADYLKPGNYYLTKGVTLDKPLVLDHPVEGETKTVNLCLNGNSLTFTDGGLEVWNRTTLNVSDCGSGGKIVSNNYSAISNGMCATNIYGGTIEGNHMFASLYIKEDAKSTCIYGGTITNTNTNTSGYDVYNMNTLEMAGNVNLSKGISLTYDFNSSSSRTITLSGKMTNTTAIPINVAMCKDGATVIKSDGNYTITKEDMEKFTLKNSGYSLQLQGTGKDAKVVVKKQEQTGKPFYGDTSGWAFSEDKALIRRVNDVDYIDDVTFKLYDAKTGGTEIVGKIEKIDSKAFYVTDVTEKKEYFVSAQEKGKSESERMKVTVYPKKATDFTEDVYFNTPLELKDYLNIMKTGSANESDSKVSLSQDITVKQDMWFTNRFKGILDLGGNTLTHDNRTKKRAIFTEAKILTLQNGTIETKSEYGIRSCLGKTVLNKITVKGVVIAVDVLDGNLEVTDSNLMIVASGDGMKAEEFTATLKAVESNVAIHDGTLSNEVTSAGAENYTYVGNKKLSEIIATGSTTTQTSKEITSEVWYKGSQGCKDQIVITPSTQSKLDQIFGAGNTTFVAPNSINVNKDIGLDDTATITEELLGVADVTINLNGNNITVKPATGAGKDAIVADADVNLTIKGPGSIAGGNSTNSGNGGDAVSGSGNIIVNGGATITGGNGAGTGNGGNGIDITGSGNVTIDNGTVTGGSGTTGGNGSETDSGNITINTGGSSTGGSGATGGNGSETDSGNITISGGGTSTGGAGTNGSGSTAGGTGGVGTVTGSTGNTTINGSVTGGNGGNGSASGNGGNGGSGVTEDGTIGGSGTITGGNGGNIPEGGTGTPGSGGKPITGGGGFPNGKPIDGQAGLNANAKVEVTNGAPTVTVPERELIVGAATAGELADNNITHIEVTLTVKKNEDPTEKDKVDSAIAKGQEVGVYLDIALEKVITNNFGATTTSSVTEATKPITITVTIPENMRKGSEYKIIRVHNGAAETITPTHDATKHTLTFKTDKFSTYAIAYTPEGGSSGGGTTVIPPVVEDDDHINTPTTGEIEADVTVDDNGKATATVDDKTVSDTIKKAEEEAKKNGTLDDGITLVIHVNTKDKGAKYIAFNLSKATQEMILQKKIIKTLIVVDNPKVKITLDSATVKEMNRQANGDILISATLTSGNKLSAAAKKAIGTRPVFDLKATYSGGIITDLGKGKISVEIPYTLRKGETASGLMAVSVDDKGKVSYKTNSSYKAKKMIFNLRSMGIYGVGHKKSTAFTDTKKHWAKEDISFVVSRGLISGGSKTKFSPNTAMNRADLVTALGKIAGVKASDYKESSFTDVKDSAAYMLYVEWAVKNGIIKDMGNGKFSPKGKITREELALILQNFAKVMDVELSKVHEKNTFADNSKISPWAVDAVKAMQMAGIIMGEKNNRFDPKGSVTRAQTSATIKRFIELMIDRDTANGWQQNHSGGWMYFEAGKAVKSRTKKIAGKKYTFDRYGVTTGYPQVEKPVVKTRTYKVKRGDSFWKIAQKYKVNMYTLAKINGKTIHSAIHPGDVLKIPNK